MNFTDIKKFDSRFHFNLGITDITDLKHWALYEPIFGRFLFISKEQDISLLQEIRMLCSSRYNLWLCDTGTADNYSPKQIDNVCCENWSITNIVPINVLMAKPIGVETIIPCNTIKSPSIQEEKNWIQFVNYWVSWIRDNRYHSRFAWTAIDSFVGEMFGTETDNELWRFDKLSQKIRLELYTGLDIESTENKIINWIDNPSAIS
jgi:hypothetical protein